MDQRAAVVEGAFDKLSAGAALQFNVDQTPILCGAEDIQPQRFPVPKIGIELSVRQFNTDQRHVFHQLQRGIDKIK